MEAKELRIGNYMNHTCLNEYDETYVISVIVKDISFNYKSKLYQIFVCEHYDDYINDILFDRLMLDEEELFPIPLTEEWLLKFGFKTCISEEIIYYDLNFNPRFTLRFYSVPNELDLIQDGKVLSFKANQIKFVHQLQNLYFALTGEELIYS